MRKVSVIMGIFNCEKTLEEAIQSLQKQTYTNIEILMCNDGSTDKTSEIAKKLRQHDSRIRLLENEKNRGLSYSLNRCLEIATGDFIARMDGDDICVPNRFEKQVEYLEKQNDYMIVSSAMTLFDENGIWGRTYPKEYPLPEDIISGSPIAHAPVMMKKECMDKIHGYSEANQVLRVEDVDLWIRLYEAGYKCYNIQEPLYGMRNDKNALRRRKYKYRLNSTIVRIEGCKKLNLKKKYYFISVKPMLVGLVPSVIRNKIRRIK